MKLKQQQEQHMNIHVTRANGDREIFELRSSEVKKPFATVHYCQMEADGPNIFPIAYWEKSPNKRPPITKAQCIELTNNHRENLRKKYPNYEADNAFRPE